MGFKGVGEAIEQGVALAAVVRLERAQRGQALALAQLVEPVASPGAVVKDAVQIGASNGARGGGIAAHPAEALALGEGEQP